MQLGPRLGEEDVLRTSITMKILTFSLFALLVHLPIGQSGCPPADYSLLGCFADSGSNRLMPNVYVMSQEESMSTEICYIVCDDGFNTHFGTQFSRECWCAINPDLTRNGPELDHGECDMLCAGTTSGEHCGGVHKMLVYKITTYQGCHNDSSNAIQQGFLLLSSEDEQIIGQPWDFQTKHDTTKFVASRQGHDSVSSNGVSTGSCDVDDDHKKLLAQVNVWQGALKKAPRVFCGIYTHQPNHSTKVKAIKETWASHCDGFVAFSNVDDPEVHSFKIKHEGPEEYDNMWQKSRSIWKYINFHYIDEFDWFLLGGDDLFIIVENLRKYLLSDDITRTAGGSKDGGVNPVYLGRRVRPFGLDHRIYNYGGPSYVLNRASVRLLAQNLDNDVCRPHAKSSSEDQMVSQCFRKNGVMAYDTRDALGRERFHPFTPAVHLGYRRPQQVVEDCHVAGVLVGGWFALQAIDFKFGRECCSRESLSFHNVDDQLMMRLYHFLYSCPRDPVDVMAQA